MRHLSEPTWTAPDWTALLSALLSRVATRIADSARINAEAKTQSFAEIR